MTLPAARLSAVECREFIRVVTHKAGEMRVPVSVAIVGPEGNLISLERMDDAGFVTPETAWSKAYTVAAFRSMSPRFPNGLVIQQWFKERNPQMLMNASVFSNGRVVVSGGSWPVFKENTLVGAFGISGGTSQQDEVIAMHAVKVVGWQVKPLVDDMPEDMKPHIREIYRQVGITGEEP